MSFIKNKGFILISSILFIIIYIFTSTISTDYSWLINIIDYYIKKDIFYNSAFAAEGGWDILRIVINSYIVKLFGNLYINYWLMGLVYSLFSIYMLYKLLVSRYVNKINIYLGVMSYILLAYFTSIYIGTRPENIYVSSIVILLYTLHKFNQTNHYKWIYISSLISIFGALSHPNGIICHIIYFCY